MPRFIFRLIKPLSVLFGKITAPWVTKAVDSKDYNAIATHMRDGDILLSMTKGHLTNLFIKGTFKHAAIIYDMSVIEAIGEGVVRTDLFDFLRTKDKICLLRPKFMTADQQHFAALMAAREIGHNYDYLFANSNSEFYCSELVIFAINRAIGKDNNPFKYVYNGHITLPNDFYLATNKFEVLHIRK